MFQFDPNFSTNNQYEWIKDEFKELLSFIWENSNMFSMSDTIFKPIA